MHWYITFVNKQCVYRIVFIDAIIMANNGEAIEAVAELINNKELSDSLAFSWLSNLGNAKNPTKEALSAVSVKMINYYK